MSTKIYEAIKNLPYNLITPEIIDAGIEEGHIQLINILPKQYLTTENIKKLTSKESYSFYSFDLSKIPAENLDQEICDIAVEKKATNYLHVPDKFKSITMAAKLVSSIKSNLYLLPNIPEKTWNAELVYKGLNSIGSSSFNKQSYQYNKRSRYSGGFKPDDSDTIKNMQVFLSLIPDKIKNKVFYHGLFAGTKLSADDIHFLTPDKLKDTAYFALLSQKDISLVPPKYYTYSGMLSAIESQQLRTDDIFGDESNYKKYILEMMDDAMADLIAKQHPYEFEILPDKFQTSQRLLLTIESNQDHRNFDRLVQKPGEDEVRNERYKKMKKLLTRPVCFALIKNNNSIPLLPDSIWDEEFIDHCLRYSSPYYWLKQMPQNLQTKEFVNAVLEKDEDAVKYVHKSFINSNMAMKLYRIDNSLYKYLPQNFFADFREMTGLPDKFYGGETSFFELKQLKESYHYCRIGNAYIGYYRESDYTNAPCYIILTRSESGGMPKKVFERRIKSFHSNWLEKMIADYDPQYRKPTINNKGLKSYSLSLYYDITFDSTIENVDIYCNTFMGEPVQYIAKLGSDNFIGLTKQEVIDKLGSFHNPI